MNGHHAAHYFIAAVLAAALLALAVAVQKEYRDTNARVGQEQHFGFGASK